MPAEPASGFWSDLAAHVQAWRDRAGTDRGAPAAPTAPPSVRGTSRRAWLFLGITFAVTWGAWGTLAAFTRAGTVSLDAPLGTALLIVGGSAPAAAAYLAAWRTPGAGPLRELTGRVLRLRAPPALWAVAIVGAPVVGLVSMTLSVLVTDVGWPGEFATTAALFTGLLATTVVFGGIEEVGWRGVLQPAVTARWRNLTAANLVIAGIWGLWHLPLFWVAGGSHADGSLLLFILAGIGYSAVMTWLYARTESVALCVIFHAGINAAAASGLAFGPDQTPGFAVQALVTLTAGTALLWFVASSHRRHEAHP